MSRQWVLSDGMWARVEPLLPSTDGKRGRRFRDHRQVIEGILYRLRTSVPWRDLPDCYGPWQTVWKRHNRFSKDGTYDRLLAELQVDADALGLVDWNVCVDSTIARAHQHATNIARCSQSVPRHTGGTVELQGSAGSAV
jgi:transposase